MKKLVGLATMLLLVTGLTAAQPVDSVQQPDIGEKDESGKDKGFFAFNSDNSSNSVSSMPQEAVNATSKLPEQAINATANLPEAASETAKDVTSSISNGFSNAFSGVGNAVSSIFG